MADYDIGEQIPDVKVTDPQGHLKRLSEQMGARGLLVFILRGTWCAFCVDQIASVQRSYRRFQSEGVTSVFISPETEDSVWTFRISQPRPLSFGLHADPKRQTTELFIPSQHVGVLPAAYLLDTDLRVVWRYIGEDEEDRPSTTQLLDTIHTKLLPA